LAALLSSINCASSASERPCFMGTLLQKQNRRPIPRLATFYIMG
jgi:hypothetical protein